MATCANFQSQLLDYLYDLLDADERRTLEDHLKVCSTCPASLEMAKGHRRLLGIAAKAEFSKVRFETPPVGAPRREERPHVVAFPQRRWAGLAAAAAVLLLVAGLGVPGGIWAWKHHELEQKVQAHQIEFQDAKALALNFDQQQRERREQIQQEVVTIRQDAEALVQQQRERREQIRQEAASIQQDFAKANADYSKRINQLQRASQEQRLRLNVTGPAVLQPGAPNTYQIQVRDFNNQPAQAQLTARVRDQDRKVVHEVPALTTSGSYTLTLPAGLSLKPDGQLALEVLARRPNGPPTELRAELPLAAPLYVTHVTTDKPMYQPGESVRFRSLTLERFSLKPPQDHLQLVYTITNPLGSEVFRHQGVALLTDVGRTDSTLALGPDKKPVRGVGAGEFTLHPELPGGEYTLTVTELNDRFPKQERKFLVNRYQKDRLLKELDYNRKSYGPADEVMAACKVKRAEGGSAIAQQPVQVTVNVDGKTYGDDGKEGGTFQLRTDPEGKVNVRFKLPAAIEQGRATLSVVFTDGGSTESLVKPIPIVLKKLNVEFFPEGGDLIAGAPNRVYFQVRSTLDKPADLAGRIVDDTGKVVADKVETLADDKEPGVNQGMGAFTFKPEAGKKYELKIDTPRGMEGRYLLPEVKAQGVVLHAVNGVLQAGEPLGITVHNSGDSRELVVGVYCRGRLLEHKAVAARANAPVSLAFAMTNARGGVYRVTVFEQRPTGLRHVAERLLYHASAEQLNLSVKPAKERYVPGDPVTLSVQSKDEKQAPAPAILMMAVVDKSVLTMADEKTHRSMPTHFLLTTEVRKPEDLEYADFLLGKHPKAARVLDLLLGTQGWRRFAEQEPDKFRKEQRSDADRLLVLMGQTPKPSGDLAQREAQQARLDLAKRQEQLQERHEKAQLAWLHEQQQAQIDLVNRQQKLQERQEKARQAWALLTQDDQQRSKHLEQQADAQRQHQAALGAVSAHRDEMTRYRTIGLWLVLPLLLAGAGICLMLAILRNLPRAMPYYAVSAVCMLLVLLGFGLLQWSGVEQDNTRKMASFESPRLGGLEPIREEWLAHPAVPRADDALAPLERAFPGTAPDVTAAGVGGGTGLPRPGGGDFPLNAPGVKAPEMMMPAPPMPAPAVAAPRPPARGPEVLRQEQEQRGLNRALEEVGREKAKKADDRMDGLRQADRALKLGAEPKAERAPMAEAPRDARRAPAFGKGMPQGGFGGARRGRGPDVAGGLLVGEAKDKEVMLEPLVLREYAHRRPSSATPDVRRDFTETLYWHPVLVLPDGNGEVKFELCDSVTTFQVAAVGHTLDGRLGTVTTTVEARKPFTLEPRIPLQVTADDKIDVPVSVANNTSSQTTAIVRAKGEGLNLLKGQAMEELPLGADQRKRLVYRFQPSLIEGPAQLYLEGAIPGFEGDRVLHTFQVVPQGFPVIASKSDMLEKVAQDVVALPKDWLKGTLKARVEVYPSTLADLQKGLAALLREPGGCFEQTSTSNYPNLLILDYLKETEQALPEVEKRARELLGRGYQRLTSYECPYDGKGRNGFEWFGQQNNAHEALTAYGLMQFRDMARVQEVDPAMIERTKQWLLARKDGKGGFQRNPRALDTFGRAPEDITNAYIIWALTESSPKDDVTKELDRLLEQAKASKDPYFLALVANSLLNRSRNEDGCNLLKKIAEAQKPDGHLDAVTTSITGSGGRDLQIETTALAVYGWLKANRPTEFNKPIQSAVKWIGQQRGGHGGFGSTQSTILALKALIAFAKANKKTPEAGELTLFVGEEKVAGMKFPAGASEALTLELPDAEKHLKAGKNNVRVEITGKNVFPYTLSWSYQTLQPVSAEKCPVKLETKLAKTLLQEGDTVRLTAKIENVSGKGQGMAVAILGLPAGLSVPEDMKQLKDYTRIPTDGSRPLVGAFEINGRELVLYWRDLQEGQKIEVPIDLVCRVPGEYSGPASRAYLYYNADHKHWIEPLKVAIAAKAE